MTQAKIAFELSKEPRTSNQLHILTHIGKNILKRKLDYLVDPGRSIIFRHKHTSPDLINKKSYLRPAYSRDYYLLNWSKPEAKELVQYYYDYSPEYRKRKIKEQESEKIAKLVEEERKKPIKKKKGESEEDFNKRKEELKKLEKQVEVLLNETLQREKEEHKRTIEDLMRYIELSIGEEKLLAQQIRESGGYGKSSKYY